MESNEHNHRIMYQEIKKRKLHRFIEEVSEQHLFESAGKIITYVNSGLTEDMRCISNIAAMKRKANRTKVNSLPPLENFTKLDEVKISEYYQVN